MIYLVVTAGYDDEEKNILQNIRSFSTKKAARAFFKKECKGLVNDCKGVEVISNKKDYYAVKKDIKNDIADIRRADNSVIWNVNIWAVVTD